MVASEHAIEIALPTHDGCTERASDWRVAALAASSTSPSASSGIGAAALLAEPAFARPCRAAAASCRAWNWRLGILVVRRALELQERDTHRVLNELGTAAARR